MEANNSKAVPFGPADSTVESCSLSVEAEELKKIGSLVEANFSSAKSNDCLTFRSSIRTLIRNVRQPLRKKKISGVQHPVAVCSSMTNRICAF